MKARHDRMWQGKLHGPKCFQKEWRSRRALRII
jgi:hypothetical protein